MFEFNLRSKYESVKYFLRNFSNAFQLTRRLSRVSVDISSLSVNPQDLNPKCPVEGLPMNISQSFNGPMVFSDLHGFFEFIRINHNSFYQEYRVLFDYLKINIYQYGELVRFSSIDYYNQFSSNSIGIKLFYYRRDSFLKNIVFWLSSLVSFSSSQLNIVYIFSNSDMIEYSNILYNS